MGEADRISQVVDWVDHVETAIDAAKRELAFGRLGDCRDRLLEALVVLDGGVPPSEPLSLLAVA